MACRANSDFILHPTRTTFRQADVEVRPDGVDAEGSVFVEVFAHVGKLRGGQRHKVSADALKLLAIRAVYSEARLILAFADGEAAASVSGVVRTRLRVPPGLDDQGPKERVINRLSQMRFTFDPIECGHFPASATSASRLVRC